MALNHPAVAQRLADGLAILQVLAYRNGSVIAGRLNKQHREDLAKTTLQSWTYGQDDHMPAWELLWKLRRYMQQGALHLVQTLWSWCSVFLGLFTEGPVRG